MSDVRAIINRSKFAHIWTGERAACGMEFKHYLGVCYDTATPDCPKCDKAAGQ